MRRIKNVPLVPAALYLLSVAAIGAYVIYRYESAAGDSESAGMYLVLLTLPWSMFLDPFLRGGPDGSIYRDVGRLMLYGLVNAAIIYAAFALLMRLVGTTGKPAA